MDRLGNTGCVIMASGLGKRFGANKLMADFNGEPLICRALAATEELCRVVVTRHRDVARLCKARGILYILHDLPLRSDTVRLGINALRDTDRCLFCPGDQPLLTADTVRTLVLRSLDDPEHIWRPRCKDIAGAPVVFPKKYYGELSSLPDGAGGGYIIKKHPGQIRYLDIRDEYELKDVDRPEELQYLAQR